jgi:hypothetical protein
MMIRNVLAAAALACFLLASVGHARAASVIVSGMLQVDATTTFKCIATNIGKTTVGQLSLAIVNTLGPSIDTTDCPPLAPDSSCSIGAADDTSGQVFCRVTTTAQARNIRATLIALDAGGHMIATSEVR